ncbi:hypothetical protein ABZ934_31420 [Streptomyces sp. NPDC046557]|uniref:hypothetical protein n=1 Tax=Streptomyces sp. NPDC046557 TaxID=3155372 RepID=UPI00340A36FC
MFEQYDGNGFHDLPPDVSAFRTAPDWEAHVAHQQPMAGPDAVNSTWDPAEELAQLLQQACRPKPAEVSERFGLDEAGDTGGGMANAFADPSLETGERLRPPIRNGHRRASSMTSVVTMLRTGSFFTALLVAAIATVVSIFSGLAVCEALRRSADPRTAHDVVSWWPLLIYGPWTVASLSILRAALHQRRAVHSWSVVLLFSTLATLLCLVQASSTFAARAAATLPPIAALACLQQLVRQITLTRPPRQPVPRHRGHTPSLLRRSAAVRGPDPALPHFPVRDQRAARTPTPARFRYGS